MKKLYRNSKLLALSLFMTIAVGALPVQAQLKPNFDLTSLDGSKTSLQSQVDKDKWLLVMFWATDCTICEREKPIISKFHDEHKGIDAQVVGVALDGYSKVKDIEEYLELHKPSFPSYTGDYFELASRYTEATGETLRGTPTYLLYTPDGELVGNNPGPVSSEAIERFIEKYGKSHR